MFLKPPKNISNPAAFIKIAGVPCGRKRQFICPATLPPILPESRVSHPEESIPAVQLRPVNFPVEDS
jgi:hypothetical protein